MKYGIPLLAILCAFILSCGSSKPEETQKRKSSLTNEEIALCESQHIDTSFIILLRSYTSAKLSSFNPDSIWYYDNEYNLMGRAAELEGLMIEVSSDQADSICSQLAGGDRCAIFVYEKHFGPGNEKDKVAIVNSPSKYTILREMGTNGINYDLTNDDVQSFIETLDVTFDLTLIGAGVDWCEFTVGNQETDWNILAARIYEFCPDVVDQGTGSVEDLAQEMKRTNTLYLWWD